MQGDIGSACDAHHVTFKTYADFWLHAGHEQQWMRVLSLSYSSSPAPLYSDCLALHTTLSQHPLVGSLLSMPRLDCSLMWIFLWCCYCCNFILSWHFKLGLMTTLFFCWYLETLFLNMWLETQSSRTIRYKIVKPRTQSDHWNYSTLQPWYLIAS